MEHSPAPREISSRFEKLLAELVRHNIDFALVGGLAVILNGYPRVTLDADILISERPENVRKLLDFLVHWGEGWARELRPEEFIPQEGCIRVSEDFDLDIFTRMQGHSLEDFRGRLRWIDLGEVRLPVLAPADLILLKSGSWREKDKFDVLALQEILAREARKQ